MNKHNTEDLKFILDYFNSYASIKFKKGAKEHGGRLEDQTEEELLFNALDEAVDQVNYIITILKKRNLIDVKKCHYLKKK